MFDLTLSVNQKILDSLEDIPAIDGWNLVWTGLSITDTLEWAGCWLATKPGQTSFVVEVGPEPKVYSYTLGDKPTLGKAYPITTPVEELVAAAQHARALLMQTAVGLRQADKAPFDYGQLYSQWAQTASQIQPPLGGYSKVGGGISGTSTYPPTFQGSNFSADDPNDPKQNP